MEIFIPTSTIAFLQYSVAGNSLERIAIAIVIFFGILLAIKIFRRVLVRRLTNVAKKTRSKFDDKIMDRLAQVSQLFYVIFTVFLTTRIALHIAPASQKIIDQAFVIIFSYEILKLSQAMIIFWLKRSAIGKNKTSFDGMKLIFNILLWSIGALLVLSNIGFDVSTLIASLGVGGIAIALAAQTILGDLFASFSIYFDKPFEVGDYVAIGDREGTIKKIGLKTTRIETLRGEELVMPNSELTKSQVQNFRRMEKRLVKCQIGVTYDTPHKKLEKIPGLLAEVVQAHKNVELVRAHFASFGDFSLGFELAYYVLSRNYADMMDARQAINLEIVKLFENEKIEFAFPTQTLYVKKD